jgi:hypothetical protein
MTRDDVECSDYPSSLIESRRAHLEYLTTGNYCEYHGIRQSGQEFGKFECVWPENRMSYKNVLYDLNTVTLLNKKF